MTFCLRMMQRKRGSVDRYRKGSKPEIAVQGTVTMDARLFVPEEELNHALEENIYVESGSRCCVLA